MAEEKNLKKIKKITQELVDWLELPVTVEVKKGEEETVAVQLETDNPGLLIGYHGQTLSGIQLILSKMVYHKLGEWEKIVVNVGDYREKRQESLEKMAMSAAQKVKFSGEDFSFQPMSPVERRIIHLKLSDHPDVTTESIGESRDRRVVVKLKSD